MTTVSDSQTPGAQHRGPSRPLHLAALDIAWAYRQALEHRTHQLTTAEAKKEVLDHGDLWYYAKAVDRLLKLDCQHHEPTLQQAA